MASLTIRKLDERTKRRLKKRAAENGRSMEEEARQILREAVAAPEIQEGLGAAIHRRFAPLGGVELELLPRGPDRDPPDFGP